MSERALESTQGACIRRTDLDLPTYIQIPEAAEPAARERRRARYTERGAHSIDDNFYYDAEAPGKKGVRGGLAWSADARDQSFKCAVGIAGGSGSGSGSSGGKASPERETCSVRGAPNESKPEVEHARRRTAFSMRSAPWRLRGADAEALEVEPIKCGGEACTPDLRVKCWMRPV